MNEKVDMSQVGGDGSRESGTGIGMSVQADAKAAEAGFLDAAAEQLDNLTEQEQGEEERPRKKKRRVAQPREQEVDDDRVDEQEVDEGAESFEEEEEPPEEEAGGEEARGDEVEGEEEEAAKVSIRLNGKKATIDEVLDHVGAVVVVNGEEVEVTGAELIKGYQRGKDYSEKTTEMKRERDEAMPYNQMVSYAKQDPQFLEHVQNYFQNGPFPELTANPDLKTSDAELALMLDQNDASYDPQRASKVVKLRAEWIEKNKDRQAINERAQHDMQERWSNWSSEQVTIAQATINQIGLDQGVQYKEGETEYGVKSTQVLEYLKASGYNEAEINGQAQISTTDARAAITAYKASEYDRMMRESDAPRVTLGKKRKRIAPPRSQKPGSGTRRTSGGRQQRDTFRRASKEQTTESWITAIDNRLNGR